MQWIHAGLNILQYSEVKDFYHSILGFEIVREFSIDNEVSQEFFQLDKATKAILVNRDNVTLELFLHNEKINRGYTHLCFAVNHRENIAEKCLLKGYPVIRKKREKGDLIFILDGAGNIFELKEEAL